MYKLAPALKVTHNLRCSILNHNYLYHSSEEQFLEMLFNSLKFLKLLKLSLKICLFFASSSLPEKNPSTFTHSRQKQKVNTKIRITSSRFVFQKNDKDNNDSEFDNEKLLLQTFRITFNFELIYCT